MYDCSDKVTLSRSIVIRFSAVYPLRCSIHARRNDCGCLLGPCQSWEIMQRLVNDLDDINFDRGLHFLESLVPPCKTHLSQWAKKRRSLFTFRALHQEDTTLTVINVLKMRISVPSRSPSCSPITRKSDGHD